VKAYIPACFLWACYSRFARAHHAISYIIIESKVAICAQIRTEIPGPTIGKA